MKRRKFSFHHFPFTNMTTIHHIWVKRAGFSNSHWTQVSLDNVEDIDDLKTAIKNEMTHSLDAYASYELILKAMKKTDSDEHAVDLKDPMETIASVQQRYGDDFHILVSPPNGKWLKYRLSSPFYTTNSTIRSQAL